MERQGAGADVLQGVSHRYAIGQSSTSDHGNFMDVLSGCVLKVAAPL